MLYALVNEGQFVESRDLEPEMVATHKLDTDGGCLLRPLIQTSAPDYVPGLEDRTFGYEITPEAVTETWTVTRKSAQSQADAVKAEARRRIVAAFPEWKQANMTARAVELIRDGDLEHADMVGLTVAWGWIKSVREASNALEAMSPIPLDYQDDSHWPSSL